MKKIIKLTLILLIGALVASICSCSAVERLLFGGDPYNFSDVVLTQTGVNEFKIEFTANCGKDDVDVYFTEGFRLSETAKPIEADKSADGNKVRFAFTKKLNFAEDYYVWLISGDKEARLSITIPSMFPSLTVSEDGAVTFNFNYTYGTAWDSFCDPTGKAVYKSQSPVFDATAEKIRDGIEITEESTLIPADKFDANSYYFAVSTSKNGLVKSVSTPVTIYDDVISSVSGVTATLTTEGKFEVGISIPESSSVSSDVASCLQLVVKTDVADDIKIADCVYQNGVAKMSVDLTELYFEGVWYDVLIAWRGSIVMDLPKNIGGKPVDSLSSVKLDGIVYNITGWKPDGADESADMIKVFYEKDTMKYADEVLRSYLVTFGPDDTLNVTVKLRSDEMTAPVLAITGGDKTKLA